jgi:hypothetical protein
MINMVYEVILVHGADQDIDEAILWYEKKKFNLGICFYFEVLENLEKLKLHPQHYSFFQDDYRQVVLKSFPYKIVFKISSELVIVFAVFHTGRKDDEFFKRSNQ